MNRLGLASFTLSFAAACAAATVAPELLQKKLASLAGVDAQDCGSVALRGARAAVVACAQNANAAGRPYRLTVELEGGDFSWQGAARAADGKLWVVFYGADAAEGAAASPSLSMVLCREIRFKADSDDDVLECIPSIGGH